jgi:Domain of unknown function (DUF6458)
MGIGTSVFLIAVGAILKFAVTASVSGIKLEVVGVILMIAGAVGLVASLLWSASWQRRRRGEMLVTREPY